MGRWGVSGLLYGEGPFVSDAVGELSGWVKDHIIGR